MEIVDRTDDLGPVEPGAVLHTPVQHLPLLIVVGCHLCELAFAGQVVE